MHSALAASLAKLGHVVRPASELERPPAPVVPFGIAALDALTGGLPRGALTEICGPPSSGRTSVLLAAMAATTARGELCALVDASDCFDPLSAEAAGVDLRRVLWVRCGKAREQGTGDRGQDAGCSAGVPPAVARASRLRPDSDISGGPEGRQMVARTVRSGNGSQRDPRPEGPAEHETQGPSTRAPRSLGMTAQSKARPEGPAESTIRSRRPHPDFLRLEQALKATDLILQAGGFGMVVLDLANLRAEAVRRVPLTSWFRFRRAVENTPAVLLAIEAEASARTCASLVLSLEAVGQRVSAVCPLPEAPSHTRVFEGIDIRAELTRGERKGVRAAAGQFHTRTAWGA